MAGRGSTIREVAIRAGVSVGTASKVFNSKGKLTEDTRQRVLQAATDLHFVPNALIRSLQRGRTYSIGVFTWEMRVDLSRDITMHLLKGITDGIEAAGCDTLLYSHLTDRKREKLVATAFLDGRIDGLVLASNHASAAVYDVLALAELPTVVLYCKDLPEGLGSVDVDNAGGVREAVAYLIGLGHRRIAFFAPWSNSNFRERRDSCRAALEQHGIPPDPALCLFGENQVLRPEGVFSALFGQADPPTALIAGDDAVALEWLRLFAGRGVRVPEDVSVVGFDDVPAAVASELTTIQQPAYEVGKTAIRFVERLIAGESAAECRAVLPVMFVQRGTTGPPSPRK